jgi:uncharacterized membrane protein YfcA
MLIGMTGMGGGAIMTPFLILVMKVNPVLSVGTDLVFAAVTKWTSGLQHRRQDNVDMRMLFWLALGSVPMSFLTSSLVVSQLEKEAFVQLVLPRLLGAVLVLIGLYTLARLFHWIREDREINWPPAWALTLIGAVGGGLVGLTSVGSGTVIMASLLIFYALPPEQMVGLDVMHGALLTTIPALVYISAGQVDWHLALWMLAGSLPGALIGTYLVNIVPKWFVKGSLSLVLLITGLRMFG